MSNVVYLVAAYVIAALALAAYVWVLRRQRTDVADQLAASPKPDSALGEPGEPIS